MNGSTYCCVQAAHALNFVELLHGSMRGQPSQKTECSSPGLESGICLLRHRQLSNVCAKGKRRKGTVLQYSNTCMSRELIVVLADRISYNSRVMFNV